MRERTFFTIGASTESREAEPAGAQGTSQGYDWAGVRGDKWCAQLPCMEGMLRALDEPLVDALRLEGPCRIAEVGCGGGATAIEVLRRAPEGSVVHGFDISRRLVEAARGRAPAGEGRIAFEVADVATAAPTRPYARLMSRFGVMFFDDPPAAFANLARWLESGGRFAFAVWGPPADNGWVTSAREVVARFVEVPKADPDGPGPFRYADPGKLVALLEAAGFVGLGVREWRGALPIGGQLPPDEAARFALAAFSSFGELLAAAGDDALAEAHDSLTRLYSQHQQDGAVWMDARVWLVTGERR